MKTYITIIANMQAAGCHYDRIALALKTERARRALEKRLAYQAVQRLHSNSKY